MKKIVIKKLTAEGFGSLVKPTTFIFDRPGINLMLGKVGAGKTTILSALIWALYGITLKKQKLDRLATWSKYRPKDWRGTRVIVEYEVDGILHKVARHYKFEGKTWVNAAAGTSIELLINGIEYSEAMINAKKRIEQSLGIVPKVFLNSILFGQRMNKFIEASPADKRLIFELIFDLEFIDRAKEKGKKQLASLDSTVSKLLLKKEAAKELMDNLQREYKEKCAILKQFDANKQANIETYTAELASIKEQINELFLGNLQSEKKEYDKKAAQLAVLNERNILLEQEVRTNQALINELSTRLATELVVCRLCGQRLTQALAADMRTKTKAERKEAKEKKEKAEALLESYQAEYVALADEVERLEDLLTMNADAKKTLQRLKKTRKTFKKLLKEASQEVLPNIDLQAMETNIGRLSDDVLRYNKRAKQKAKEARYMTWWITKALSASGLKSYILDAMLEKLNKHLGKYVHDIGFGIHYSIDVSKKAKPFITRVSKPDGQVVMYEELSGGEKSLIEIASVCAMHDMITEQVDLNILLLDEVFEGLGSDEMSDVYDIIRKKDVASIFIITHRDFNALNCNVINFSKKDNQTIIR